MVSRYIQKNRSFNRIALLLVLTVGITGCGSLYIEDPSVKQVTEKAHSTASKLDAVEILGDHAAFIAKSADRRSRIAVDRSLIRRDLQATTFVTQSGPGGLKRYVSGRFAYLVGDASKSNSAILGPINNIIHYREKVVPEQQLTNQSAARVNADVGIKITQKKKGKTQGTVATCPSTKKFTPADLTVNGMPGDNPGAPSKWVEFVNSCKALIALRKKGDAAQKRFDDLLKPTQDSQLGYLESAVTQLSEFEKIQKNLEATANAQLKHLKEQHACLIQHAGGSEQGLASANSALKLIDDFLVVLSDLESTDPAIIDTFFPDKAAGKSAKISDGDTKKATSVKCPIEVQKIPDLQALFKEAGLEKADLEGAKKLFQTVGVAAAVSETAKSASSKFKGNQLLLMVQALAGSTEAKPKSEAALRLGRAILRTTAAFEAKAALEDGNPGADALLVSIAFQQYRSQSAAAMQRFYKRQAANLRNAHASVLMELYFLKEALVKLRIADKHISKCKKSPVSFTEIFQRCGPQSDSSEAAADALIAFRDSWNRGRLHHEIAAVDLREIREDRNFEVEKENLTARIEMIKPLIAQLAVYGEGGIKPEMIARAVNALLLLPIAIGVN